MNKIIQYKKILSSLLLFCIISAFFILSSHPAYAKTGDYTVMFAGLLGDTFLEGVQWILVYVLMFVSWLLPVASSIFSYIVDAKNITTILNANALWIGWGVVRDTLNIAFILVLIFTAFSTIFQVEKYNYKKLLLTLVLMALLVNFSWPIIRFIIDISNTMMYTIIKGLLNGPEFGLNVGLNEIFSKIAEGTNLSQILKPTEAGLQGATIPFLIAAIVFVFILAATLLTFSILMVVRIVALAILIVFSPIAFVGSIFPASGNPAGKFWDYLFKYSFFGPLMMFVLYLAVKLMAEIGPVANRSMGIISNQMTSGQSATLVAAMAYYAIPITILWIGMGTAKSMSIFGAESATKFGMGAVKKVTGVNFIKRNYDDFKKEREDRRKESQWKTGKYLGGKLNDGQDRLYAAFGSGSAKKRLNKRQDEKQRKDMDDASKKAADTQTTDETVVNVNSVFNATGKIDPKTKVSTEQAGSAKAFTRKNSDEKKDYIADQLAGKGATGLASSSLKNMLGGVTPNSGGNRLEKALHNVINRPNPHEKDLRTVAAFIGTQSEEVMKKYTKTS